MSNSITFYGIRGSMPANGPAFHAYGGDTSCYAVHLGNTSVFVDAGSGVRKAAPLIDQLEEVHLLLTHTHLDHITGILSLVSMLEGRTLHVYGSTYEGLDIEEQIKRLIGPPIWPVTLADMQNTDIRFHAIDDAPFVIGDMQISTMQSNHPGGCTLYRLEGDGQSVVIASDFNHADGYGDRLVKFADHTDLLVYDGSMSFGQYALHPDYGHSTAEMGAEIGARCHAAAVAITHHGHEATDDELDLREHDLRSRFENLFFAYQGLNLKLNGEMPGYCSVGKTDNQLDKLENLMEISMKLSSEKDPDRLFEHIIRSAMEITKADGGTLYTMENNEALHFRVMITKSLGYFRGGKNDPITLPPVKLSLSNVCAASAITKRLINIEDVYADTSFDFSGPKNYDAMTGYHTRSVMVVPMENINGDIIGVLQLINATADDGHIVSFTPEDEEMVNAIASQAGISISNISYAENITNLLEGFVRGFSTGIDARTPYNANHTKNMVAYANAFLDYENAKVGPFAMGEEERAELTMSVWLHDIGKLAIPLEVMDKSMRLTGMHLHDVRERYGRRELLLYLAQARGDLSQQEFEQQIYDLYEEKNFIMEVNKAGYLSDLRIEKIKEIGQNKYRELDGSEVRNLTSEEVNELTIQKGTLTAEERKVMQDHVSVTAKMLSMLNFPKRFKHVPEWAGNHHEFLDGSGYPNHLKGEQLSWPARLITILDIFEALTAADRPYRRSMSVEKALEILQEMADEGKLDRSILAEYVMSEAWVETMEQRKREATVTVADWQQMGKN